MKSLAHARMGSVWLRLVALAVWPPAVGWAQGQPTQIDIDRTGVGRLIPISIEGFSGEAAKALTFDLQVAGFDVVAPDRAQYWIGGNSGSSLVGRVTDRITKQNLISKEYVGGNPRSQAHTFADEIVRTITGRRGIARTRIAFKVEQGRNSEIHVSDYDGYNPVAITRDNTINRDPAWVPGNLALYYVSYKTGNPRIYGHDLKSGTRRQVAGYTGDNFAPAISPDGRYIAMILSRSGNPDLYVADADGRNLRRLTQTKEEESSPCWSPDSRRVCVVSTVSGRPALYVIGIDGGSLQRLRTEGAINTTEPDWSPDGSTIVFTAQMGGFQIFTVPAGGGAASLLVPGEDPSWAPNSRTVIYTRRAGDRRILSLLDVPTKRVFDIQHVSGNCSQAAWAK